MFYRISLSENPGLCLQSHDSADGMSTAVLTKCRIYTGNETDPQVMFVRIDTNLAPMPPYGPPIQRKSIYSISGIGSVFGSDRNLNIIFTGEEVISSKSLQGLLFKDPAHYQETSPSCPISQFSVPHSTVRNTDNLPFFLPGHQVEILCDQGYGVKRLNYTTLQIVVCPGEVSTGEETPGEATPGEATPGEGTPGEVIPHGEVTPGEATPGEATPRYCSRIIPRRTSCRGRHKEEKMVDLRYLFVVIAIVSSTIAVGLLVVLVMRRRREEEEEVEEGRATNEEKTGVKRIPV